MRVIKRTIVILLYFHTKHFQKILNLRPQNLKAALQTAPFCAKVSQDSTKCISPLHHISQQGYTNTLTPVAYPHNNIKKRKATQNPIMSKDGIPEDSTSNK